jgi:hypothetical protein
LRSDDDSAELATPADNTSPMDRSADPHAINCPGSCEPLAQCRAEGGIVHGACIFAGTICCE